MKVAVMIEGQNGLTWARWKRLAAAVEALQFDGLFRSDHFTNANPPDRESLDLWPSLTFLADRTERIEFGPLVAPVSFRHPVFIARMGRDVDELSGNRLVLGVGAGWQEREHQMFGFDLLDVESRLDRFEEGVEVIAALLRADEPVSYAGEFYELNEAALLPRPARPGGPPLLVGGNGRERTLPLAARLANEWNAVFVDAGEFASLNRRLDELIEAAGRQNEEVRRSVMTNLVFGRDQRQLDQKLAQLGRSQEELRRQGRIVGTPNEVIEQIREYEAAGAQLIMLQWLDLDDMEGLTSLAESVLPKL